MFVEVSAGRDSVHEVVLERLNATPSAILDLDIPKAEC